MALSNKFGYLVLTTGNKSELAVGLLHALRRHERRPGGHRRRAQDDGLRAGALHQPRAARSSRRPASTKPPSAELRPNQTDQDTLPPYDVLDAILKLYVDEGRSPNEIVAAGFERATVVRVIRTVDRNEYKRRQAAPGLKVTTKAFGMGRRMPMAARYSV